jgi:hypothetical protein
VVLRSTLARTAVALTAILTAASIQVSVSAMPEAVPRSAVSSRGSARIIVESSAQINARAILIPGGVLAYERLSLAKHRVSLVLSRSDSIEWGFAVTHLPRPGVTVVDATARIRVKPELRAVIKVSDVLMTHSAPSALLPGTLWGTGLEWKRIVDPLAVTAGIDYFRSADGDAEDASIHGSMSLLLTDTISLSLSASVSGICQSSLSPALGISLASRKAPNDTLYARVDASLAPADSVCVSVGVARELE